MPSRSMTYPQSVPQSVHSYSVYSESVFSQATESESVYSQDQSVASRSTTRNGSRSTVSRVDDDMRSTVTRQSHSRARSASRASERSSRTKAADHPPLPSKVHDPTALQSAKSTRSSTASESSVRNRSASGSWPSKPFAPSVISVPRPVSTESEYDMMLNPPSAHLARIPSVQPTISVPRPVSTESEYAALSNPPTATIARNHSVAPLVSPRRVPYIASHHASRPASPSPLNPSAPSVNSPLGSSALYTSDRIPRSASPKPISSSSTSPKRPSAVRSATVGVVTEHRVPSPLSMTASSSTSLTSHNSPSPQLEGARLTTGARMPLDAMNKPAGRSQAASSSASPAAPSGSGGRAQLLKSSGKTSPVPTHVLTSSEVARTHLLKSSGRSSPRPEHSAPACSAHSATTPRSSWVVVSDQSSNESAGAPSQTKKTAIPIQPHSAPTTRATAGGAGSTSSPMPSHTSPRPILSKREPVRRSSGDKRAQRKAEMPNPGPSSVEITSFTVTTGDKLISSPFKLGPAPRPRDPSARSLVRDAASKLPAAEGSPKCAAPAPVVRDDPSDSDDSCTIRPDDDDGATTDYSVCVSTIAFSSDDSDVPRKDEAGISLTPIFKAYGELHSVMCRRQFSQIPSKAAAFTGVLSLTVEALTRLVDRMRDASMYESAYKGLVYTRELFQSHVDKMQPNPDEKDTLATGYLLLEMTMSALQELLFVIETEREYLSTLAYEDARLHAHGVRGLNSSTQRIKIHIGSNEDQATKRGLISRLRKLSQPYLTLGNIDGIASPLAPAPGDQKYLPAHLRAGKALVREPYDRSPSREYARPDLFRQSSSPAKLSVSHRDISSMGNSPQSSRRESVETLVASSPMPYDLPLRKEDDSQIIRRDGKVIAATLPALVRHLTDPLFSEDIADTLDSFFLFFRSFTPPTELLRMLRARFNEKPPEDLLESQIGTWRLCQRYTKITVAKLLALWAETYWKEETDRCVFSSISDFAYETIAQDPDLPADTAKIVAAGLCACSSSRTRQYGQWLTSEIKATEEAADTYGATPFQERLNHLAKLRENEIFLIDIAYFCKPGGADEIARQLTVIESEFFHSFLPEDLIHYSDPSLRNKLTKWKAFSQSLTVWVANCIVGHHDLNTRVMVTEFFITIAAICKGMRNYNSALAILLGLQSQPIAQLSQTHAVVALEYRDIRARLEAFFDCRSNWRQYRAELPVHLPAVPIAAVILKDVKQNREVLPRIKTMVEPLSQPIQDQIPLQYYRNMRRTVRDLERCYGFFKLQRVDHLHGWILYHVSKFDKSTYDVGMEMLRQKSTALESMHGQASPVQQVPSIGQRVVRARNDLEIRK